MEKKCKIVILLTENNTKIGRDTKTGELSYLQDNPKCLIGYYMYLLSDDKIKEGDWFIWNGDNNLMKAVSDSQDYTDCYGKGSFNINISTIGTEAKKIIATTNPDLIKEGVASIDDEDIQNYCNNPVDSVLVKYEELRGNNIQECGGSCNCKSEAECLVGTYRIKISFNGSIIIKSIEETWEYIWHNCPKLPHWKTVKWFMENYEVPKKK